MENLQPIGSFKIRGAGNALANLSSEELKDGVYTASAGNFAQGLAWNARERGIPCNVVVPDHAPVTKLEAIKRLGGNILKVPFDQWWEVIQTHQYEGMKGKFIHPVCDPAVIAGKCLSLSIDSISSTKPLIRLYELNRNEQTLIRPFV